MNSGALFSCTTSTSTGAGCTRPAIRVANVRHDAGKATEDVVQETMTTAKSKLVARRRATILLRGTRAHRPYTKHHSPHMKHKLTPPVSTPYQRCLAVALLSGFPEAILGLNNGQNTNFMPKLVGRCQNVRPCCTISAVKTHFCGRNRASKRGYAAGASVV